MRRIDAFSESMELVLQTLTFHIGPFLWMFSDSQGDPLLLLSSAQQVSYSLIIYLQKAAGIKAIGVPPLHFKAPPERLSGHCTATAHRGRQIVFQCTR